MPCALEAGAQPCSLHVVRMQVRYIACQWPNSLVFVAGAPSHPQRERDSDPWAKMEGGFSVRHLIQPMRLMAEQCMIPAENLVRAQLQATPDLLRVHLAWRAWLA